MTPMVLYHSPSIYNKYRFSQNSFPISANCFFIAHINLNPLQLVSELSHKIILRHFYIKLIKDILNLYLILPGIWLFDRSLGLRLLPLMREETSDGFLSRRMTCSDLNFHTWLLCGGGGAHESSVSTLVFKIGLRETWAGILALLFSSCGFF